MKSIGLLGLLCFFLLSKGICQNLKQELALIRKPTTTKRDSLVQLIQDYREKENQTPDSLGKKQIEIKLEELDKIIDQTKIEELRLDLGFVRKHIKSSFALEVFSQNLWTYAGSFFLDSFIAIYPEFPLALRESAEGKKIFQNLKNFQQSSVGSFPPNFIVSDINGKKLQLIDLKGKFILLDFWASWCVPCRADFPTIKQLYNTYHENGFEVISISRDDDLEAWRKAVEKDGTASFHHISTKLNKDATLLEQFFVWAIPVKILIDRNGKIVGRWRGGGEANKKGLMQAIGDLAQQKH